MQRRVKSLWKVILPGLCMGGVAFLNENTSCFIDYTRNLERYI